MCFDKNLLRKSGAQAVHLYPHHSLTLNKLLDIYKKSEPTVAPIGGWMVAAAAVEIYSKVRVSEAMALCTPLHKLSREAIPNKQPQSQGVMEDFTGTVDG